MASIQYTAPALQKPHPAPGVTGNENSGEALRNLLLALSSLGLLTFQTTSSTPAISGSRGGNVALANLVDQLAQAGYITDNTTP